MKTEAQLIWEAYMNEGSDDGKFDVAAFVEKFKKYLGQAQQLLKKCWNMQGITENDEQYAEQVWEYIENILDEKDVRSFNQGVAAKIYHNIVAASKNKAISDTMAKALQAYVLPTLKKADQLGNEAYNRRQKEKEDPNDPFEGGRYVAGGDAGFKQKPDNRPRDVQTVDWGL